MQLLYPAISSLSAYTFSQICSSCCKGAVDFAWHTPGFNQLIGVHHREHGENAVHCDQLREQAPALGVNILRWSTDEKARCLSLFTFCSCTQRLLHNDPVTKVDVFREKPH